MRSHEISPPDRGAVLIAAISGRALAGAAARAGYRPLVADMFADLDTREIAGAVEQVEGTLETGMDYDRLAGALQRLGHGRAPLGLVYGSGFEARAALLEKLGKRWRLYGNEAAAVALLKDPLAFAGLCGRLGIPHPQVCKERPPSGSSWLAKRAGAAGGGHITPADRGRGGETRIYYQAKADGEAVSALFLADGRRARIVGFSRQWASPTAGNPYRYGGAVRGPDLDTKPAGAIGEAIGAIVRETGLVGLNSADCLIERGDYVLLEINPRPGASLDVFADRGGRLFDCHLAACSGVLDNGILEFDRARASRIVYASRDIGRVPQIDWPEWTADRQPPGTMVTAGGPLCTVFAEASSGARAVDLVESRAETMRRRLEGDDE